MRSKVHHGAAALLALAFAASAAPARAQLFEAVTLATPTKGGDVVGALILTDPYELLSVPTFPPAPTPFLEGLAQDPVGGGLYTVLVGAFQLAKVDFQTGALTGIGRRCRGSFAA